MRAALYLRVSTEQQADEGHSLPAQKRLLVEYCEHKGWEYEIYEDAGISGETIEARPAMLRLLEDAAARKFDVALAVEMERFSRSTDLFDWLELRKTFRAAGIKFGTPAQVFDPDDAEDAFLTVLFGALAAREKQKIMDRTNRGRVEAARRGRYVSAQAPYGYRKAEGTLVVHEPEAQTVRLIFGLLAQGHSIRAIIRELCAREIPAPRGAKTWGRSTIQHILKNPVYSGTAYYGRQQVAGRHGRRRKLRSRDRAQWIPVPVPAILSEEGFQQAHVRLRQNATLSSRNQKRFYLLKGLVRCGTCGKTMVGKFCGGYRYYTCAGAADRGVAPRCRWHAAPADVFEALVWQQVTLAFQNPDLVLAEARRYRESKIGQRDELLIRLDYVQKTLRDIPQERERIQTLFREGFASLEETKSHLATIERKRSVLEDEQRGLEARLAFNTADEEQEARLERIVAQIGTRLTNLTDGERFEVAHGFIERVVVGKDGSVEIQAYVPVEKQNAYVRTTWEDFSFASMTS